MYVCVCNAITEKDIHQAVGKGISSLEKLSETNSISKGCGCCTEYACQVIKEALKNQQCPKNRF